MKSQRYSQRLRERFLRSGLEGFAPHEILELLLTLAIPRSDVKPAAHELLNHFKTLRAVLEAPLEEIRQISGVGLIAATALKILREIATVYLKETAESKNFFRSSDDIIRFWCMRIGVCRNEVFEVGFLDSSYSLLRNGIETLDEGTIDRVAVYPRRVMESARFAAVPMR
ncbi:MAG: RadC family protein [Chitinivibrionales bacterium]|nr:RadC family protein [Chitinivibrionales bacterium]